MHVRERVRLDELLTSEKLPSPSGVALKVLEQTRDDMASANELERTLSADPALSGQILKYANSARIGGRLTVATLADAIVRLGMTTVRSLALGFSLLSNARRGPCERFDYDEFWAGSLATAVCSQALAEDMVRVPSGEAFTCGLLHQIGRLCLASVHNDEYSLILERWNQGDADQLLELEVETLSIDHDRVSVALFEDWGLPEYYRDAILYRRDPDWSSERPNVGCQLSRLLNIAGTLGAVCFAAHGDRDAVVDALQAAARRVGLNQQRLPAIAERVIEEWFDLGQVLEVPTVGPQPTTRQTTRPLRTAPTSTPDDVPGSATDISVDKLHVLVIDDDPIVRHLITKVLSAQGHTVTTATSGKEGLKAIVQHCPPVVITDWMMPEMDGLDLCRAVRRSDLLRKTYVIVLTAKTEPDNLLEAFAAGADDYLAKPVDTRVLLARLGAAQRVIALQEIVEDDRNDIRHALAQLSVANRKLEHMAHYDQLTTLPNRRYALDRLDQEWDRARRTGVPLLCMLIDIDRFKRVNDNYGHDVGDVVLRSTGLTIQKNLRMSDVVCRFGGEEFLAICPAADLEEGKALGDRIRTEVADNTIEHGHYQGRVTISIGVASSAQGVNTPGDLVKLADEYLYAAKEAGRNRVCIADRIDVDPETVR